MMNKVAAGVVVVPYIGVPALTNLISNKIMY